MIDEISDPGAWAREIAARPKRCDACRHFRWHGRGKGQLFACAVNGPLLPCGKFEREPGADDDRGEV